MRRALRRELERFRPDVVHVSAPALGRLGLSTGRTTVLDMMDVESAFAAEMARVSTGPRRLLLEREARRFADLERRLCAGCRAILVSSGAEAGRAPCATEVVPNGVALSEQAPAYARAIRRRVAFVGLMSWRPNVDGAEWLVSEVLPKLPPDVSVDLVGRDPAPRVRALASARVRVLGEVPDVPSVLATAAIVVVPLLVRAGTRLKVLEGLAAARPVVATREGADGLVDLEGDGLLVAGSADAMASAIEGLVAYPGRAAALGRRGRASVASRYGWDRFRGRLLQLYRDRLGLE
jgi:glycosyltransferase involved in cell wall biosynthesis